MDREIYTPAGGPPPVSPLIRKIFDNVGEEALRELVHLFYQEVDKSSIRYMFPEELTESETKAADFLIQVFGGPQFYTHKYQQPRMRQQHMPFEIDEKARRAWLGCYKKALEKSSITQENKDIIWEYLTVFSTWMVNKKGE